MASSKAAGGKSTRKSATKKASAKKPARTRAKKPASRKKAAARSALPMAVSIPDFKGGFDVATEVRKIVDEVRRGAMQVIGDLENRQQRMEREGARIARSVVKQFRVGLTSRMGELQKRVAKLERQAAALERKLS